VGCIPVGVGTGTVFSGGVGEGALGAGVVDVGVVGTGVVGTSVVGGGVVGEGVVGAGVVGGGVVGEGVVGAGVVGEGVVGAGVVGAGVVGEGVVGAGVVGAGVVGAGVAFFESRGTAAKQVAGSFLALRNDWRAQGAWRHLQPDSSEQSKNATIKNHCIDATFFSDRSQKTWAKFASICFSWEGFSYCPGIEDWQVEKESLYRVTEPKRSFRRGFLRSNSGTAY
jgi:hypothetical protein